MPPKPDINSAYRDLEANFYDDKITKLRELWSDRTIITRQLGSGSGDNNSLTVSGDLPSLKFNAQLSSSGDTLTLTPTESGMGPLYGDDGVGWNIHPIIATVTLNTAGSTSGRLHDIYVNWDQTLDEPTVALSSVAWTNETTRSVAIVIQDGVALKSTDTHFRLLAVCRYNGSTMLVPKYDPNGEIIFGTGDPRNNVADPHTGVGMSAGGVTFGSYIWQFWAALAGVVGVGFNNLGQLLAGAGAVVLDALGISLISGSGYVLGSSIKYYNSTGTKLADLYAYQSSGTHYAALEVQSIAAEDSVMQFSSTAPSGKLAQFVSQVDNGTNSASMSLSTSSGVGGGASLISSTRIILTSPINGVGSSSFTPAYTWDVQGTLGVTSTAPTVELKDTTALAKSLTIKVDANKADFRESAGAAASLLQLDLATNAALFAGALTVTGAATFNGAVTLGDAVGDAITFTGTPAGLIVAGAYTPTLTNTTNIAASTAYVCQYIRVGSNCTVSGRVDVDPTAAAATLLGISLPIASNVANANECAGTGASGGVAGQSGAIQGDAVNDRASLTWVAVDTANRSWFFTFTYQIL